MPKIGFKHSEETKKKLSEIKKKQDNSHLTKYKFKSGRKLTEEQRLKAVKNLTHKFSKGHVHPLKGKSNPKVAGENSSAWKGGITPMYAKLRKQRMKENGGSHTLGEWENLKTQYGYTCPMCEKKEPDIKLTKDHIIPVSRGGSDFIENIQPLCVSCNSKKHDKLIDKVQINIISLK